MKYQIFLFSCLFCAFFGSCHADKVIWSGKVSTDGTPTSPIKLNLNQKYQITVSGVVNLGTWVQNGEALANDACYEFSKGSHLSKLITLRNSNDIPVGDGHYHPDHVYKSEPFIAQQNKIHFWVYDKFYDDNTGDFQVQITQVSADNSNEE